MAGSQTCRQDMILITGASGFIGSAIAGAFRREGYRVRVLIRPSSPRTNVDARDDVFIGDILNRKSVAAALDGVRYLVHAAADYRLWAPSSDDIIRTNFEGTRIVMEEALRAGVERVVYTSSVATFDLRAGGLADESRSLLVGEAVGAYKRSKVMAERLVEDMVKTARLPAVIVNPSTPIGPRDVRPTPTGRIVVEAASGRMPAFVDTGLNLVHVDDVAAGHVAALQSGRIGERYILGGENVTLRQMLSDIASIMGRRPPRLRLPRAAIYPLAAGAELFARVTGRPPFVTLDGLRMSRYRMFFDDSKARRELGYTSRPYREGLMDAIDWFRQAGQLRG
ncbi:MAG: NAD-dependent epimerase/dehydratase family protein [Methylocystis sp.]|nr:NAD-dependent epimerase/dehydratase family protein [Methylocystis sp.]